MDGFRSPDQQFGHVPAAGEDVNPERVETFKHMWWVFLLVVSVPACVILGTAIHEPSSVSDGWMLLAFIGIFAPPVVGTFCWLIDGRPKKWLPFLIVTTTIAALALVIWIARS